MPFWAPNIIRITQTGSYVANEANICNKEFPTVSLDITPVSIAAPFPWLNDGMSMLQWIDSAGLPISQPVSVLVYFPSHMSPESSSTSYHVEDNKHLETAFNNFRVAH